MRVNPYLMFNGECAEAFKFYEQCLGGKLVTSTFGDSPMADQMPEAHDRIMHASLQVGDTLLMGSDQPSGDSEARGGFSVALQVTDTAEAERLFAALAEGGSVTMPIQETFWSKRFGMLTDRFGIPWFVDCGEATP